MKLNHCCQQHLEDLNQKKPIPQPPTTCPNPNCGKTITYDISEIFDDEIDSEVRTGTRKIGEAIADPVYIE